MGFRCGFRRTAVFGRQKWQNTMERYQYAPQRGKQANTISERIMKDSAFAALLWWAFDGNSESCCVG
jgi:hypothetical protein